MKSILIALLILFGSSVYAIPPKGMVKIDGGDFTLFFDKDKDGNNVSINVPSFYLDEAPVTNAKYLDFVKNNPEWLRSKIKGIFSEPSYLRHWLDDTNFGEGQAEKPVRFVSWFSASAYCENEGKELPRIVQWEFVAAADEKLKNASDLESYRQKILQWYSQPSGGDLADVKQGPKNYWGVYDLHGLLWEWNQDYNTAMVTGESREDSSINRDLFCGSGSLGAKNKLDYGTFMRFGYRSSLKGNYAVGNLGFRCAKSISQVD